MSDLKTNLQEILQEKQDKIIPENIKKNVQIFDVIGTYEGSDITLQEKSVDITNNGMTEVVPDSNYYGLSKVNINTNIVNKPNIFMQETEPETKEGIWLQANKQTDLIQIFKNINQVYGEWDTNINISIPFDLRDSCAITSLNNEIYFFGGMFTKTLAYKYNIENQQFIQLENLPFAFHSGHAITIDNIIYLFGGNSTSTDIYQYDGNEFTKLTTKIPFGFTNGGLCAINHDLFLFGGTGATSGYPSQNMAYKFNMDTNTFVKLADIPFAFNYGTAVPIGTNIYLFGGSVGNACVYDTLTDTYDELNDIPSGSNTSISAFDVGKNIYIIRDGINMVLYDTIKNEYVELTNVPDDVSLYKSIKVGNKIYGFTIVVQIYNLIDDKTIAIVEGSKTYETQLYTNENIQGRLLYSFDDVYYNTAENGLDDTLPTYYGDGTQWIKFKN